MASDVAPAGLARGLLEALSARSARITTSWEEGARTYVVADSPEGRLFGRSSSYAGDVAVLEHEAAVRGLVGAEGPLRAPPVFEQGPGWLLEAAIEPEQFGGPEHVDLVAAAADGLQELELPEGPPSRRALLPALRRRLRILRSPLSRADLRRARGVVEGSELPLVTIHGDFHPKNVLVSRGAVWVVDWELSGHGPAGSDLLHFWATIEGVEDRERLFEAAVELVGRERRPELLRLRYTVLVRAIVAKLTADMPLDRDPEGAQRLLALLPEARREAGIE